MRKRDTSLEHCHERKKKNFLTSIDIRKSVILISLQHPIHKHTSTKLVHTIDYAGWITSFSSDDVFLSVSSSAKKPKLFVNDTDSKEN